MLKDEFNNFSTSNPRVGLKLDNAKLSPPHFQNRGAALEHMCSVLWYITALESRHCQDRL